MLRLLLTKQLSAGLITYRLASERGRNGPHTLSDKASLAGNDAENAISRALTGCTEARHLEGDPLSQLVSP